MRKVTLVMLGLSVPLLAGPSGDVAKGWFFNCGVRGDQPCAAVGTYRGALDRDIVYHGAASVSVTSESSKARQFGGVHQMIGAADYRGKRVRYSAQVRTENVTDWAGLWLRADDGDGRVLAFDNMETSHRGLRGTREWSRQEVVLDIPQEANAIRFGLVLSGAGKAWLDDVHVDIVAPDVPVTLKRLDWGARNVPVPADRLQPPRNLDFED